MLDATLAHLSARNYIRDDKVHWAGIIDAVRTTLLDSVVEIEAEIEAKAMTVAEIREVVLGSSGDEDVDAELNQKITSTLGITPKGRVQKALENGHVLCSARIHRSAGEGEPPVSTSVRFVSDNPDVVEQFNTHVLVQKAVNATSTAHEAIQMTTKRIVLLAPKKKLLLEAAQNRLAEAMPLWDGQP